MNIKRTTIYAVLAGLVVWVASVGAGWFILSRYEATPAEAPLSLERWPWASKIVRTPDMPTLLMFVHPHCPCSRASMEELSRIMANVVGRVRTEVVFIKPAKFNVEWVKSSLWADAARIPGVHVMIDEHGREAALFRAAVSGQTLLYDKSGHLVFSGGITSSRGHEGDNDGRDAIIAFLTGGTMAHKQTPFFGCMLFSKQEKS